MSIIFVQKRKMDGFKSGVWIGRLLLGITFGIGIERGIYDGIRDKEGVLGMNGWMNR